MTGLLIIGAMANSFEDVFEQIGYSYPQGRPQLAPGSLLHRLQLNIAPESQSEFRPLLQLDPLPLPAVFDDIIEDTQAPVLILTSVQHPQYDDDFQQSPSAVPASSYDELVTSYDHASSGVDVAPQYDPVPTFQYDAVPLASQPPQPVVNSASSVQYIAPAATFDDANGYNYAVPSQRFF